MPGSASRPPSCQDRQVGADHSLKGLRQGKDAVGDGPLIGQEEHRVLLQVTEDVELAGDQMPAGAYDGKLVVGQVGRVVSHEQSVTDLEADFGGQGVELFRPGEIVGKHFEALVHEEHQRPVQPEEQFDILGVKQHDDSSVLKAPPEATTESANSTSGTSYSPKSSRLQ